MTNKRSQRRRPRGGGRRRGVSTAEGGGITPVAFHSLNTTTLSGVTGTQNFSVTPQNSAFFGLSEIGDQFDLFRVSRLEYRIHPMDPANATNQVLAFYPDVDIQTQTVAQASHSPIAASEVPFCGVPSPWIRVPASQLKGMLDWYKCTLDSGASEFEAQGIVQAVGGLGEVMHFEVRGVMLFKNPCSSALMMERVINRAVASGKVVRIPTGHQKNLPPTAGGAL